MYIYIYVVSQEFTLNLSKLNVSSKKRHQLFSVIILFFILIIKPLPSLLDPVGPVEQGADCQLHVDELRCLERCANRRWIRKKGWKWQNTLSYSWVLLPKMFFFFWVGVDVDFCQREVWQVWWLWTQLWPYFLWYRLMYYSKTPRGRWWCWIAPVVWFAMAPLMRSEWQKKSPSRWISGVDFFLFFRGLGGVAMPWRWVFVKGFFADD